MTKSIRVFAATAAAFAVAGSASSSASSAPTFDEYCAEFGKSYRGAEYTERKALFEERLAEIEELNARSGASWMAGVGYMTDLREEERQRLLGYDRSMRQVRGGGELAASAVLSSFVAPEGDGDGDGDGDDNDQGNDDGKRSEDDNLPKDVDWRSQSPSVVTAVRDQGGCGSCWAFAAAEVIESHVALKTGVLIDLSPQHLLSCTENPNNCGGSGGCDGATVELAFNHTIQHGGILDLWHAPYLSGITHNTETCNDWGYIPAATISGYEVLPMNDAHSLKVAVATIGPVAVAVDASSWWHYDSGIFDSCNKSNPIVNHAVVLMGYGEEQGKKYWLIRNSWGTRFGEAGYIRLRRYDEEDGGEPCGVDTNPQVGQWCEGGPSTVRVCGECGILSDASYPTGGVVTGHGRRLEASAAPVMV